MTDKLPDLVWLVRRGENEEFRYSLRSLTQNIPHRTVRVFGNPPEWYTGSLRHPRTVPGKYGNTRLAMRMACLDSRVSDPFIYANDDFFLFDRIAGVPVVNRGKLKAVVAKHTAAQNRSAWAKGATETLRILNEQGIADPYDFELHMPMLVYKHAMLQALELIASSTAEAPYMRSLAGNLAGLKGKKIADCKVVSMVDDRPPGLWLSTDDKTSWRGVAGRRVREAFPRASAYEG